MHNQLKESLARHLRHPLRLKELHDIAAQLLKDSSEQSTEDIIAALLEKGIIKKHLLTAKNGKSVPVYCSIPLSEVDTYQLAASLLPNGYFSNLTAIYHHSLTNQVPTTIYWSHESLVPQACKETEKLHDTVIRSAFIKPHRYTNFVFTHNAQDIVVTATTQGGDYGIDTIQHQSSPCPVGSRVTSLERTLINAVVSPHYNGGLSSISAYFQKASHKLDIKQMINIYEKLNFTYPYAQPLGFFMEYCGMNCQAEELRKAYPPQQRFYIDHAAKSTWAYNDRWMLFHPKGLTHEH